MTRHNRTLDATYFENMFQGDDDPWRLESSAYEAEKFDHSVRTLRGRLYQCGFEVGCAGGSLTTRLAPHVGDLLAVDISATAVERARRRCAALPQVRVEKMAFPQQRPSRRFDLMVLSEVAYYWDDADLDRAAEAILDELKPGGDLLLVHFTGDTDYPQTGDDAVSKLAAALTPSVEVLRADLKARYRLDLWRCR